MSQTVSRLAILGYRLALATIIATVPLSIVAATWIWGTFTCSPSYRHLAKDADYQYSCDTNTTIKVIPLPKQKTSLVVCQCPKPPALLEWLAAEPPAQEIETLPEPLASMTTQTNHP